MRVESLELAAAKMALGLISPEDLPSVAVDALEDGCDSSSLRILAGLTKAEIGEARQLFDRLLAELHVPRVSRREAVERLARESAKEILSGEISPYQGAKRIWQLSLCLHEEHLPDLDSFVYGASEWEDRPEDRHAFEAGIVDAARELVGAPSAHQEVPPTC